MKKRFVMFILIICVVVLIGCTRTRTIDKISIIHLFGFDKAKNGDLIGTALYPDYTKGEDGADVQYLAEQASASRLLVSKMGTYTSTPIELAKMRVIILGKGYAEAGVQDTVERLIMTPQIGTNIEIAVSTGTARETLNTYKKEKSFTLAERIQHNMQGQGLPKVNLHTFLNHFYGEGMDAYVPVLESEQDKIKVNGIGVFSDEKLKLILNHEQTVLFTLIKDRKTEAIYRTDFVVDERKQGEVVALQAFRSNRHWDWDQKRERLSLRVKLKMSLIQYPNRFNVKKPEDLEEIRKFIVESLETGMEDLLATLQKNEVDPIGIGSIVRSKDATWEKESFYKKYPTLPIDVNVDLEIIHSGLEG